MTPHVTHAETFQEAWCKACCYLLANKAEAWNLIAHVREPLALDESIHDAYDAFCRQHGLLPPRHVAYTIFPQGLSQSRSADQLFADFNRDGGFFDRVYKRTRRWGTYFRRATHYPTPSGYVNQLHRIIQALNARPTTYKAAYTMITQQPGADTVGPRGHPCLNYIALQVAPGDVRSIHILAVYRNQDFTQRAYGNYQGLGQLLSFVCAQTGSAVGTLTCYSSHAELVKHRPALRELLADLQVDG